MPRRLGHTGFHGACAERAVDVPGRVATPLAVVNSRPADCYHARDADGYSTNGRRDLMTGTPAAEVRIDTALVGSLIRDQFPQYSELRLTPIGQGWDNVTMRLGSDLLVRLPRRTVAVPLIEHEQRWLRELSPGLPIAIPVPIHAGRPGCGYPWPWSIAPWLPGEAADLAALWILFEGAALQEALAIYGNVDQATLARSKGWALLFGAMLLDTGLQDHPRHADLGAKILRRAVAGP